jgi:hypothetical protein
LKTMARRSFPQPPPPPRRYPLPPSQRREVDEDQEPPWFDPERPPVVEARSHHFAVNEVPNPRRSAGMRRSDFDPEQLRIGARHELEHTDSIRSAERIAMDHLAERPDYYDRLDECMPEHTPNAAVMESIETPEYHITPAKYAKGQMAVHITSRREDGVGTRAEFLARAIANGRHSHRERAYIMSPSAARRFHKLYQEGWSANFISWDLTSPTGEVQKRKHPLKFRFNNSGDSVPSSAKSRPYDPATVERFLNYIDHLNDRLWHSERTRQAWEDRELESLVKMGAMTASEARAVVSAEEYLAQHYEQWAEEEEDELAEQRGYSEYEDNPSAYYVWVLDDACRPIEGPYGPYSKDTAKQYARISATQGRHDRAVSVGSSPEADIIRIYEGGTGEKLVANPTASTGCGEVVRVGDVVVAYGDRRAAELTGDVISVGRVNVKVHTCVRFRPDGPWYDQEHKVPRDAIKGIVRDGKFLCGEEKIRERFLVGTSGR